MSEELTGRWDPVIALPDVAIHASLLPDGTVLAWGRRADPDGGMHQLETAPFVWDPVSGATRPTPRPTRADGTPVNLFCTGHAFLPDGRLLVAGGHISDGDGLDQVCAYDHRTGTWTALPRMRSGRWYPTVTAMPDGRVLVISGSHRDGDFMPVEAVPEIGDDTGWADLTDFQGLPLYPRMHVAPDGRVFMSGSIATSYLLDAAVWGTWSAPVAVRAQGDRQYGPAVCHAPGQVIYLGGGDDGAGPTAAAERIDLTAPAPSWTPAAPMAFRRRQHNATLLPDGSVLVTGGTRGPGFNNLDPGMPVHEAELWDPATDTWTTLASEDVDRCYHATTLLLPDATVLSAGGGEFMVGDRPNAAADTHRDGQVFHPPYLFRGPRPEITAAPEEVLLGTTFPVSVAGADAARVTLLRPGSVTHTVDMNQRFVELPFTAQGGELRVTAPTTTFEAQPGHHLLFVLSAAGVPSVARVVRITAPPQGPAGELGRATLGVDAGPAVPNAGPATTGTLVTVGLTAQCPYGLGPCWGGAHEALAHLPGVAAVEPAANQTDQTAQLYLDHDGLPDLDAWPARFAEWVGASYAWRGVEVTLTGTVTGGVLHAPGLDGPLPLRPLRPGTQLAWDVRRRRRRPPTAAERDAFTRVPEEGEVTVTGPLRRTRGRGRALSVRVVEHH